MPTRRCQTALTQPPSIDFSTIKPLAHNLALILHTFRFGVSLHRNRALRTGLWSTSTKIWGAVHLSILCIRDSTLSHGVGYPAIVCWGVNTLFGVGPALHLIRQFFGSPAGGAHGPPTAVETVQVLQTDKAVDTILSQVHGGLHRRPFSPFKCPSS